MNTTFTKYLEEATSNSPVSMADAIKLAQTLVKFADRNNDIDLTGDLLKAVGLARDFLARHKAHGVAETPLKK